MIRNIIFDFGNVLANVDFERFQKNILSEIRDRKLLENLLNDGIRKDFESGLISSAAFLNEVIKLLEHRITKEKFVMYYNGMITEKPDMKKFLIKLSKSRMYKFFLLSNTNPIHVNYARKKFPYIYKCINNIVLSYKVKEQKPDSKIYMTMLTKYHLKPEECLFIDDLEANCLTAKQLGMRIIHFKGFRSFIKKFKSITRLN